MTANTVKSPTFVQAIHRTSARTPDRYPASEDQLKRRRQSNPHSSCKVRQRQYDLAHLAWGPCRDGKPTRRECFLPESDSVSKPSLVKTTDAFQCEKDNSWSIGMKREFAPCDDLMVGRPRSGSPSHRSHRYAQDPTPPLHQSPGSDFWTGGEPRYSPASSINSLLHGSAIFDADEQDLTLITNHRRHSSSSILSSPALPPPPVKFGEVSTFDCDICGQELHMNRKREWQKHVLNDLQPYLCTFPDCPSGDESYASRKAFERHEMWEHEPGRFQKETSITCLFCQEVLPRRPWGTRSQHIGRHMEEIAFSVVRKPCEDWDFYTDSSIDSAKGTYYCECTNYRTGVRCNTVFCKIKDLRHHEEVVHHFATPQPCNEISSTTKSACRQLFESWHQYMHHGPHLY